MVSVTVEQSSFAAGQIDTAAQRDPGKTLYKAALQKGRNLRIKTGGAASRRPGLWRRATLAGEAVGIAFDTDAGDTFKLIFSDTQLDVYDDTDTLVQTLTGMAWAATDLNTLYLDRSLGKLVVSHDNFWPKTVSVDSGGTWSVADFAFDDAFSGGPAQPYYRYADKGITLTPSALTGSITLTTSAAVFVDSGAVTHVGAYFRYLGYPVLITAVASGTSATGTVVTKLPPTVTFDVDNADGFAVDEEAEGLNSGAKGIITNISGNTITFVYATNFNALKGPSGDTPGETLVGGSSQAQATLTNNPSAASPAALVDWDEQAWSPVRGYPGCGVTHRGRLYFTDMRDLPRGLTASGAGLPNYFLVGDRDGDSFFELLPDYKGQRARHVVTADQGLVLSDKAAYYLPEYSNQPVTPSTIDFKLIAAIGASAARPIPTEQGFAYVEEGANRVIGVLPTGSVQQPWATRDVSQDWYELLTGPVRMGTTEAATTFPERYSFALNTDGTAACVKYQDIQAQVPLGWTPWDSANAKLHAIFPAGGKIFAVVQHTTPAAWTLEEFDDSLLLDCAQAFSAAGSANLPFYAGTTVRVMDGVSTWWWRGDFAVDGGGNLTGWDLPVGDYIAGYDIATELKPVSPVPDHPAYRHGQRIGIPRVIAHTVESGAYTVSNQDNPALRSGESNPPPKRTEAKQWRIPGRAADIAPDFTQSIPAPFTLAALNMDVAL